jgi:hypothetical protein
MLRKAWNDPVWSKVIAGAILAATGTLLAYVLGWWPGILRVAEQRHALPSWLLVLLTLAALPTPVLICAALWYRVFPPPPQNPSWFAYTTDVLLGIRWRWRYSASGNIFDLASYCPACDFQIYAKRADAFRAAPRIAFSCECCGSHIADFDGLPEELENKTTRLIQKNLRSGEWNAG